MDRSTFFFEDYSFNYKTGGLELIYRYNDQQRYVERVEFSISEPVDEEKFGEIIDAIAFYIFIVAGTSYYKIYAPTKMVIEKGDLDDWQAGFFNMLYRGGLSQYVYENELDPETLAIFEGGNVAKNPTNFNQEGVLLMQSGGKDSLLSAELMKENDTYFESWHMSSTGSHPEVIDLVGKPVIVSKRMLDLEGIKRDEKDGGLNGHIPFSALYAGFALLQAVLSGKNTVIASNEASADEANVVVDGYSVNHQFSKTFKVELSLQEYIHRYISPQLNYGSALRPFSELRVGELFSRYAWEKYKDHFSSCNLANYKQGEDGKKLKWDGTCPKCANTFLLLAPFVEKSQLLDVFEGKNLLTDPELTETYLQLFGLSEIKPFECVGTFEEMQLAYNMAVELDKDYENEDLQTSFLAHDFRTQGAKQPFLDDLIDYSNF